MKIHWTQNPLRSVVILDDADRWVLREALEMFYSSGDDDPAWLNSLHTEYEQALREVHVGDCTCVPCSCLKCSAEALLGIDTTPGLTKHMGHHVASAFGEGPGRSLDEAIEVLAKYDPKPSPQWEDNMYLWHTCLPGWREEACQAHAWLTRYRNEHFK